MSNNPSVRSPSSSSKFVAEQFQDEDGTWRVRIKSQKEKFDDNSKSVFLSKYSENGRMEECATAAGVTGNTVRRHMRNDDDFAEACLSAEHTYRDRLITHHQNLLFNGTVKENYDRNGKLVSKETIYPIRLIELELKKHDEGYRDNKHVDVNVTGGVLVAPAETKSIEDWETRFGKGIVIDGEATEVESADGKSE